MSLRPIVRYPDPVLSQTSEAVAASLDGIESLVADMTDTMVAADGAGLAAVQIGVLRRVFIVDAVVAGRDKDDPPMVFIDPEIIERSAQTEVGDEGCLSFPGVYVQIRRACRVTTRARDVTGAQFEVTGEGLFARAMQHEADHLDGRLITDHVGRMKRQMIRRRMLREAAAKNA